MGVCDLRKRYRKRWKKIRRRLRFWMRVMLLRVVRPMLYRLACLFTAIDPKLVLFANESVAEPGDNFLAIMDKLTALGYRCVYVGKIEEEPHWHRIMRMNLFYITYARARAVFHVELCSLTGYAKPRKGTDIVQLWHGCGAFKKFGYSSINSGWGASARTFRWFPMHQRTTYVCVSSPEVIPCYMEAMNLNESHIKPWGAPRTDFFFREHIAEACRDEILRAFPDIGSRKIVLYAPTFRGSKMRKARHDNVLDYAQMTKELGEDCALLLKPHPRSKTVIPVPEPGQVPFVFDAGYLPIERLLCAADLVISDYSSLIFEYALLERPMLFYAYDLAGYDSSRSFYYPYIEFVPGDLVWDTEDVITGIRKNLLEDGFDKEQVVKFKERFMSACDGHSADRILHHVLGI